MKMELNELMIRASNAERMKRRQMELYAESLSLSLSNDEQYLISSNEQHDSIEICKLPNQHDSMMVTECIASNNTLSSSRWGTISTSSGLSMPTVPAHFSDEEWEF